MGLMRICHELGGSVRCELHGVRPERFFNRCVQAGIPFWNVGYRNPNLMTLELRARDWRRIRPVARAAGCTLRLRGKRGALYFSRRMRRRTVLLAGAALLSVFFWAMNTRILSIEVTGCERVTPETVLAAMRAEGVGIWTPTARVDASLLRNHILLRVPELSWFTVVIRGSHAAVDVRERRDPPLIEDTSRPADIYADRDGVITLLRLYRGEAQVTEDQLVHRGDLLVSAVVPPRLDGDTLTVHAQADIRARVWHSFAAAFPLDGEKKTEADRKRVRFALCLGKKRINFYRDSGNPFDRYDKIRCRYELRLSDGSRLPVALIRETLTAYDTCPTMPDEKDAAERLARFAQAGMEAQGSGSHVTGLNLRTWVSDRVLYVRADGESVQKIGVTVLRD